MRLLEMVEVLRELDAAWEPVALMSLELAKPQPDVK